MENGGGWVGVICQTIQRRNIPIIGIPEDHKEQKQYFQKYLLKLHDR